MSSQYQPVPTKEPTEEETTEEPAEETPSGPSPDAALHDVQFQISPTAPWKRAALITFVFSLFFIAYVIQNGDPRAQNVAFAAKKAADQAAMREAIRKGAGRTPDSPLGLRYSKQYKFRPAASPVVTERSKNGKLKVRGKNLGETY